MNVSRTLRACLPVPRARRTARAGLKRRPRPGGQPDPAGGSLPWRRAVRRRDRASREQGGSYARARLVRGWAAPNRDVAEVARGYTSLADPDRRAAFLPGHPAIGHQRPRLYLAAGMPVLIVGEHAIRSSPSITASLRLGKPAILSVWGGEPPQLDQPRLLRQLQVEFREDRPRTAPRGVPRRLANSAANDVAFRLSEQRRHPETRISRLSSQRPSARSRPIEDSRRLPAIASWAG